jgi:hypothetical protein
MLDKCCSGYFLKYFLFKFFFFDISTLKQLKNFKNKNLIKHYNTVQISFGPIYFYISKIFLKKIKSFFFHTLN